jgi:hypothetical protein
MNSDHFVHFLLFTRRDWLCSSIRFRFYYLACLNFSAELFLFVIFFYVLFRLRSAISHLSTVVSIIAESLSHTIPFQYAKNASWNITLANAIHRSLKNIKCAKRAKIVNISHDRRSAKCVEKKSRRQSVLDRFACDYTLWANRKWLSACFDSSLIRQQHCSWSRSRTRKSFSRNEKWSKSRKKRKMNVWN